MSLLPNPQGEVRDLTDPAQTFLQCFLRMVRDIEESDREVNENRGNVGYLWLVDGLPRAQFLEKAVWVTMTVWLCC